MMEPVDNPPTSVDNPSLAAQSHSIEMNTEIDGARLVFWRGLVSEAFTEDHQMLGWWLHDHVIANMRDVADDNGYEFAEPIIEIEMRVRCRRR